MAVAKNTECKVVGTVPADQAAQLEEILAGMAGREGQEFRVLEVAMKTNGRPPRQLLLTSPMDREDAPGSSRRCPPTYPWFPFPSFPGTCS